MALAVTLFASLAFQAAPLARTPMRMRSSATSPTMAIIPPEFADLMAPAQPAFKPGTIMLELTGLYCIVSGSMSFLPLIKNRIQTPDPSERVRNYLLGDTVPASSFGWHNIDLRHSLPNKVEDLGTNGHEIGIYNGHKAYLCHVDAAIDAYVQSVQGGKRPAIEVSNEFTEHFGEKVFIVIKA